MGKSELIFIPTPGMGHLLATVELAKLILQRDHRVPVVILVISYPRQEFTAVRDYVESESRQADPACLAFVSLSRPSNPPDPSSRSFLTTYVELHKPLVKQAVLDRVESGSPKPAAFVLDMFCPVMIDVANELQVPSYVFLTSGACFLNFMFDFQSLADDEGVDLVDEFSDPGKERNVPGFRNGVPGKVVPGGWLDREIGGTEMILFLARRFREARGILVNTYVELEWYSVQALIEQAKDDKIPIVYPVGPILELKHESRGGSKEEDHHSIIEWLDQQPPSSVVFLCFGSNGWFDEVQVNEIAHGLDRTGHRFLWSLRKPPPEGKYGTPSQHGTFVDALPEGFLEKTADRGKIIEWAPQTAILEHRAIGGFVSHCGWNSTLESLWYGVPIATWPLYAEQQLNAFVLVKEVGIAVEIRMDYRKGLRMRKGNFIVTAEEVENGVKRLMSMDEEMREKLREISEKGRKALQDGGSSHHWLGCFIADVLDNVA